jgi:hypothetical protein
VSAFIVDKSCIDLLVRGLAETEVVVDTEPTEIGRVLWRENMHSVWYRYPGTQERDSDYPGPVDFTASSVDAYTYTRPDGPLDYSHLAKEARSYVYNACEHPGWVNSKAREWTAMLLDALEAAEVAKWKRQ